MVSHTQKACTEQDYQQCMQRVEEMVAENRFLKSRVAVLETERNKYKSLYEQSTRKCQGDCQCHNNPPDDAA